MCNFCFYRLDSTKKKKQELNQTEDSEDDILIPKESNKELPEKKVTEYVSLVQFCKSFNFLCDRLVSLLTRPDLA